MMRTTLTSVLLAVVTVGCDQPPVSSTSSAVSLPGSSFEIDDNANLLVDTTGNDDWASVTEVRKLDQATGQNDDSYAGGSKEDDACPAVTTGSIPNNKSDLKTFGVWVEPGSGPGDPGYMHLFWTRVQEPSGTTLMDFEFNQSSTACATGRVNPVRTAGDLLLEYRIDQGGAVATLKLREWTGTVWSAATDLTSTEATGTINSTAITAANADELGSLSARTFGEASIDLDVIFDDQSCKSFGSAMVKSRSSDSFTSQLKDFIAPMPLDISNCGKVVIRKQTEPDGLTDLFSFTHNLETDPVTTGTTFQLADDGVWEATNVLFGTGYTVTESALPAGFELTGLDCSASTGVTPTTSLATATVSFDIDNATDLVDCTYTNRAKGKIIIEKVSEIAGGFDFTSTQLGAFSLTTSAGGAAGKASRTFADLDPGAYGVGETVPTGWDLQSATCSDGSSPASIGLEAGEIVTCTFTNVLERGAIKIVKTRKHAAAGGLAPHAGVGFVVSGGDLAAPVPVVTGADGTVCLGNRVISSFVGDYTVTEVLPTGYVPEGDLVKTVTVTTGSCPDGNQVAFVNVPLTNLAVSVDSQVAGGTASTILCTGMSAATATDGNGDGTVTLSNLLPGTYTCTVVIDP